MGKGNPPSHKSEWDRGFPVLGAFKPDHLHPFKPLLFNKFSNFITFILGGQVLLPQRANNGERGDLPTPKLNEKEGFQCLGQSNWTICIRLNPFWIGNFLSFSLSYWEANSYYPRGPIMGKGNSSNPKIGWERGFSVPGAFELDHLQPFKPLLFWKFSIFFSFILGGHFLLPQGPIKGKGNSSNFQIGWGRGFSVPGAFKLDHLHPFEPLLFP